MCEEVELLAEASDFQDAPEDPCVNGSKLDIGEFVLTFRKIQKLTEPVANLQETVAFVTRFVLLWLFRVYKHYNYNVPSSEETVLCKEPVNLWLGHQ